MLTAGSVSPDRISTICRGPYGGQDPMLGNPPFSGSLANALADSLGLPGLSAAPPSQNLPTGLPGSNGGLPFNMGLPNGGARHHMDSLSAVSHSPQDCLAAVVVCTEHVLLKILCWCCTCHLLLPWGLPRPVLRHASRIAGGLKQVARWLN